MIAAAYFVGLLGRMLGILSTGYVTEEEEKSLKRPFGLAAFVLFGYLFMGGYLIGWKLEIAEILIVVVLGNLLNRPFERLIRRFFPSARYRMTMSPEMQRKLARFGRKLRLHKTDI